MMSKKKSVGIKGFSRKCEKQSENTDSTHCRRKKKPVQAIAFSLVG